ncbi:hypothetical protein HY251_17310 [bacterium]|nr:hypothetical protein [bacterium]
MGLFLGLAAIALGYAAAALSRRRGVASLWLLAGAVGVGGNGAILALVKYAECLLGAPDMRW